MLTGLPADREGPGILELFVSRWAQPGAAHRSCRPARRSHGLRTEGTDGSQLESQAGHWVASIWGHPNEPTDALEPEHTWEPVLMECGSQLAA